MALFRKIHVEFWEDPYVEELTPEQKYFFLFLLTNPLVKACGIYQITMRKMVYWTGYNQETVTKLLTFFIDSKKVMYDFDQTELMIVNWAKYNLGRGGKPVKDCLHSELQHVHNQSFIATMASTIQNKEIRDVYDTYHDTSTYRGQEEEEEEEEEGGEEDDTSTHRPRIANDTPSPTPKENETHPAAQKRLDAIRDEIEGEKKLGLAQNSDGLYKLIIDRIKDDPDWWQGVKEFTGVKHLRKDQIEDAVKKWALYTWEKKRYETKVWDKIENSLKYWLIYEKKMAS